MCNAYSNPSLHLAQAPIPVAARLDAEAPDPLVCPRDGGPLTWSGLLAFLLCTTCPWHAHLTPAAAADLEDALAGLAPDLDLTLFVAAVAA